MSSEESEDQQNRKVMTLSNMLSVLEELIQDSSIPDVSNLDVIQSISRAIYYIDPNDSVPLLTELLKKYIQALMQKNDSVLRYCLLIIPIFLKKPDFEHYLSHQSIFTPLRLIYKRADSHTALSKLHLQYEPVLIDLSKSKSIRTDDLKELLDFFATKKRKLPDALVDNYVHQIRRLVLEMASDLDEFGFIIENLFVHFPHLCMFLDSKDFINLINREDASTEFIDKLLEEMSSEKSTTTMKKIVTICLEQVDNSYFRKKLESDEKLYYQACICIYPENLSPRESYSPSFGYAKGCPTSKTGRDPKVVCSF